MGRRPTSESIVRGFILLLLLVAGPGTLLAQFDARIRTGVQVRVSTSHPEQSGATGKVAQIDSDSMVVDRGSESSLRFAVHDLTALEVYRRGKDAETSG